MDLTIYEHIFAVELNETLIRRNVGLLGTLDKKANRFGARLTRDGADVDVTGCKVNGYFIRPDEDTVLIEGTVEGNLVYVDVPADCYLYDGAFVLSVKISKAEDDFEQTLMICDGFLEKTATDVAIAGEYKILSVCIVRWNSTQSVFCFFHKKRQKQFGCFVQSKCLTAEILHNRAMGCKRNYEHTVCHTTVGNMRMRLHRLMKYNLSLRECTPYSICNSVYTSAVHIHHFPKIMLLRLVIKIF